MSKYLLDIFAVTFLDNFYYSTAIWITLTIFLSIRKFFGFNYSYLMAISSCFFLIVSAVVVASFLIVEFFSQGKGMDRLALVPYILGAAPLFFCAITAIFLIPKN